METNRRDLPTAGILVDEGVVESQLVGDFLRRALACAVDHGLGADAGVAVDVLAVGGGEVTGEVREPLLQWVHIVDGAFLAAEHGHDVVEDLGVEVLQEQGIELANLVQAVELEDGASGVAAGDMSSFLMLSR